MRTRTVVDRERIARLVSRVLLACCAAIAAAGCASDLERRFQTHVNYLASDELEGRGVGSRGIELAADYIADRFREIGLEPAGDNGTYFQSFEMTLRRTLTDEARLSIKGAATPLRLREDFVPFNFSSDEAFSGPVVFCGYGTVAPEENRDDFADVNVDQGVVLMLRGEPPSWSDETGELTRHAMFRSKVYNAKDRGAVAVLIVNQKPAAGEADDLTQFVAEGAEAYGIPAFHVTRAAASAMLAAGRFDALEVLQRKADEGDSVSADVPHVAVDGQAVFRKVSASTRNVLGLLRGTGALAEETVVVGAHYDHLGIQRPMMRRFKAGKPVHETSDPQIHNGADDNASGTSGVIETARLLAEGPRLKRSVLFIAFTGEESGLHGSKHYVEHPTVPIESTVAMLNMDMIGRLPAGSDDLLVFGMRSGAGVPDIVERAAAEVGLEAKPSPDTGGRSDHAPFIRREVPSMHFFTGFNGDYHKPSDDSHKINASGGAKVVSLVRKTACAIAMLDERPEFREPPQPSRQPDSGGSPSYRVVMGIAPEYAEDGTPGMAVEAVTPEGPADLAGMKAGDRILRISDKEVANIYDYMAATRGNKPGDVVGVVVLRDGREIVLQVTLAAAR